MLARGSLAAVFFDDGGHARDAAAPARALSAAAQENRRGRMGMEIGFIGLGNMGGPMSRRLVEAGHKLTVFDTRKEAIEQLVKLGANARARLPKSPTASRP